MPCGPSTAQQNTTTQQAGFTSQLMADHNENFGANSAILGNLTNELTPIVNAGPSQEGFSASEKAALNTQAIDQTGEANEHALQATNNQLNARGGGSEVLPSGTTGAIDASINTSSADTLAKEQNANTLADYAQGNQNYEKAAGMLGDVANDYNPNAIASTANQSGNEAFQDESTENEESNALGKDILGGVTGAADAFLGGFGKSVGQ